MKTIRLLIICLVIALNGYSQSDSVRIENAEANRMLKRLRDCDLMEFELIKFENTDSLSRLQITELELTITNSEEYIEKLNKWWKRKELWATIGFILGILVLL